MEETGGKTFRSNGKHPGDVRIARIADPLDSEVGKFKRGDARCARGHKHCSYVFVDSNQITGGRNTHGKNPQAPAAATSQKVSPLNPEVSLRSSSCPVAPPTFQQPPRSWRKILAVSFKNKRLAGGDRHDRGGMGRSRCREGGRPRTAPR